MKVVVRRKRKRRRRKKKERNEKKEQKVKKKEEKIKKDKFSLSFLFFNPPTPTHLFEPT